MDISTKASAIVMVPGKAPNVRSKVLIFNKYSFKPFSFLEGESKYDTDDKCDDLVSRLDNLINIADDNYFGDDNEFPRLSGDSIGEGDAAYGDKGASWISILIFFFFLN